MKNRSSFGNRWGLSAPKPLTKGLRPLDTNRGKQLAGKNGRLPPAAPGIRKFRRLLAQESRGIIPLGKARFPPGIFPAFPGCKASGLTAFSGRARSKTATSLAFSSRSTAGNRLLAMSSCFRKCGSREVTSLVGCGAKPRRFPHRQAPTFISCAAPV